MARLDRGTFLISSGSRVIHSELSGSESPGLIIVPSLSGGKEEEEEEKEEEDKEGRIFVVFTKRRSR